MASSSGDHGARAIARYLKVLVPASCSHNLSIPEELAQHWARGAGARGTALVVSPFGKVWRVEVARDSEDRAFLGRGWPEFVAAHGFSTGWFLVFRLEAGGMLTIKTFDTSCCLQEFSRPVNVPANHCRGDGGSRRPQFIQLLLGAFMEKMLISPKFVRKYIAESEMKSSVTVILSPLCKLCQVTVEKDRSGNLFFSGGWSQFLASHGVTEYDVLLLRYEGNMTFTVKVFGPNGCQKVFKYLEANHKQLDLGDKMTFAVTKTTEQEDPPPSSRKRKSMLNEKPDAEEKQQQPTRYTASSNKASSSTRISVYKVGPPSWMKREINAYILYNHLMVAETFCKAIGLRTISEITLRTDEGHGLRSWQLRFLVYEERSGGQLTRGWRRFCVDNGIKEGDICTFNVVETTLWHVDITRRG